MKQGRHLAPTLQEKSVSVPQKSSRDTVTVGPQPRRHFLKTLMDIGIEPGIGDTWIPATGN